MPARLCECCREPGASERTTRVNGKRLAATLCLTCAEGRHYRGACLLCEQPRAYWKCAFVAHLSLAHPLVLEKIGNDPFRELDIKPSTRKIGTVRY